MKVTRLLALLMAMLMVFPFVVFAEYEPDIVTNNYLNDIVCASCGIRSLRVNSTRVVDEPKDQHGCWWEGYYYNFTCTECGHTQDYLVQVRFQRHLWIDNDDDNEYDECYHCHYSYPYRIDHIMNCGALQIKFAVLPLC